MRLTLGVEITPPTALLMQEQRAHPESADRPRANPNSPPQAPTQATPRRGLSHLECAAVSKTSHSKPHWRRFGFASVSKAPSFPPSTSSEASGTGAALQGELQSLK